MDSSRRQLLEDAPPPVRTGPFRPAIVLICGGVVALLLLIVVLNIDTERGGDRSRAGADLDANDDVIELIAPPRPLSESELQNPESARGRIGLLAERGWIQTQARDGRPAQRYRCESLDPAPAGHGQGWLEMTQPRMEIFSDTRIVTISGDTALAYAPGRAVEQGTIEGNVVVQIFDLDGDESIDLEREKPSMVMRTGKASFENFLGEIRCDGWVDVRTPMLHVPGSGLRVLVDDQNDRVRVRLAEVDHVVISDQASERDRPTDSQPLAASDHAASDHDVSAQDENGAGADFYILSLRDNVRIDEGDLANRRTAVGDRLDITFSSRSRGIGSSRALQTNRSIELQQATTMARHSHASSLPASAALASLLLATPTAGPQQTASSDSSFERLLGPGVTLIRADGPLTIEPLTDPTRALANESDARIELTGSPAMLFDFGNQTELATQSLEYRATSERLQLAGDGWMMRREQTDAWFAFASADGAAQPPRPEPRPIERPKPSEMPELHITWEDGVDLQFDGDNGEEGSGRLRSAHFKGTVRVVTAEFTLNAAEMTVGFPAEGSAESIESIHAIGEVRVEGVVEQAAIGCADLRLTLEQTARGTTIPKLMVAKGNVAALDAEQAIWADLLTVTFRELTEADADDADDRALAGGFGRGRDAEVELLIAEHDVQVLLADGTRVFADRLEGDGVNEIVELTGKDVLVVHDRFIIDRGTRITIDRKQGVGDMPGAGWFRLFENAVIEPDDGLASPVARGRTSRPTVDENENPVVVRAEWTESMQFDGSANEGAGSIDVSGDVTVVSDPAPNEHNTMTGAGLTLEFARMETPKAGEGRTPNEQEGGPAREPANTTGGGELTGDTATRRLARLIARGDAKLESHTWDEAAGSREGDPRIFYVAGEVVDYHALTGEAEVDGGGTLLIEDRSPDDAAETAPFGARGSTMLTWDGRLRLSRRIDDVFDLAVRQNVRLRHRDLAGKIATLMCDELDATMLRSAAGQRGDLDVGGSGNLERVKGARSVEIVTEERIVNCGSFDYDVEAGIATIRAGSGGREVTVETVGSPFPMYAQEAVWNMNRDSITITRGRR